jgi:cobaltochelatase CobS
MTLADYQAKYPGAPTISEAARKMASKGQKKAAKAKPVESTTAPEPKEADGVINAEDFKVGVARLKLVKDKDLTTLQKAEVPKHDAKWFPGKREMEHMEHIAVGIEDNDNIFIFGPTGGGKTTIVKQLAAIVNTPCIRFQFSQKISIEDFIGVVEIAVDEDTGKQVTRWKDGAFTRAWREGYFIILDELTMAPAGVLMRLQGCLEGDDLVLIENGGEVVPKHERTRVFGTDNTNGRGDDTGLYAGANVLNEATLDRFGTVIKFDYPDKDTEVQILTQKTGVKIDWARKMVEVAVKIRDAFNREECYCTFSTRRLLAWAKKAKRYNSVRKAAAVAVIDKLGADDAKFVNGIIQRYFGGEV